LKAHDFAVRSEGDDLRFGIKGSGFTVRDLRFGIYGSGLKGQDLRARNFCFRIESSSFEGSGIKGQDLGHTHRCGHRPLSNAIFSCGGRSHV